MIGHAASPTRTVYVDVIVTLSKVKVKVTDHWTFRQLPITAHFHVSSATFAWSSKVTVDVDSMGPGLACRSPIFELPSMKAIYHYSSNFAQC